MYIDIPNLERNNGCAIPVTATAEIITNIIIKNRIAKKN